MNALVQCLCGLVHIAYGHLGGRPVIACPSAPEGEALGVSSQMVPAVVIVPRPEQVW